MLTMDKLAKMRVYVPRKPSRKDERAGKERDPKRIGKVHCLVFSPDSRRVVGLMVKRPDIAGMVRREDRFLALDAIELRDAGILAAKGEDSFDAAAAKRLGIDLDTCIVWGGADVLTEGGRTLGYVMDARFSEQTGDVDCFCAQEGSTATALVGTFDIPAAWVLRYDKGRMIVRDEAATLELSGGLAGKAGEGFANAKEGAKRAGEKAAASASVAVDKGTHGLGRVIGRAKVGLGETVEGFRDASGMGAGGDAKAACTEAGEGPAGGSAASGATGGAGAASSGPANGASAAAASAGEGRGSAASDSTASTPSGDKGSSTAGKGVAPHAQAADNGGRAARAVGEQLGKTKGMFSGFLREFKDASK